LLAACVTPGMDDSDLSEPLAGNGWQTFEEAFGEQADLARGLAGNARALRRGDLISPALAGLVRRKIAAAQARQSSAQQLAPATLDELQRKAPSAAQRRMRAAQRRMRAALDEMREMLDMGGFSDADVAHEAARHLRAYKDSVDAKKRGEPPKRTAARCIDVGPGFVRARECPDCGHTRCGEDCTCNCDAAHAEHEASVLRQQLADLQAHSTPESTP